MFFTTDRVLRAALAVVLALLCLCGSPVLAISGGRSESQPSTKNDTNEILAAAGINALDPEQLQGPPLGDLPSDEKPILIAQACESCGAEIAPLAVGAEEIGSKKKDEPLMTDSLWGNLILEMAYQRDPVIRKIAKQLGLVGLGTTAAIGAIAGGTLAQGISGLQTLNPPAGHLDSYTPLTIGVALSSCTLITFAGSMSLRHYFNSRLHKRQVAIRKEVEAILAHLEYSHAGCASAQKQLTELIGKRACDEWLQLWRSSHQVAMTQPPKISLNVESTAAPAN